MLLLVTPLILHLPSALHIAGSIHACRTVLHIVSQRQWHHLSSGQQIRLRFLGLITHKLNRHLILKLHLSITPLILQYIVVWSRVVFLKKTFYFKLLQHQHNQPILLVLPWLACHLKNGPIAALLYAHATFVHHNSFGLAGFGVSAALVHFLVLPNP